MEQQPSRIVVRKQKRRAASFADRMERHHLLRWKTGRSRP